MTPLELILVRFEQLSAVPRGTKNEAGLRQWLADWAIGRGLEARTDSVGNLIVYVPASAGYEDQPALILQGHLDMVCQKTPDSPHDFMSDPIRLVYDGDWLKADRTTLGADNGIAIALMMALAEDAGVAHPPLELLLTVEEEVSGVGADELEPSNLTGKTLLNLDSETEGEFTIGSAGGGSVFIHLPVTWTPPVSEDVAFLLRVDGLQGGHSGGDIAKNRANANKLLARVLDDLQREFPIRLASIQGGNARNAIPREAEAVFVCDAQLSARCRELVTAFEKTLRAEYSATESGLSLTLEVVEKPIHAMSLSETHTAVLLLLALPNGVSEMFAEIPGFVETSSNIGIVETLEDEVHIISNHRSAVFTRLEAINRRVEALAHLAGARTTRNKMFPPWQANLESPLLKKARTAYETCFGVQAKVELTHGGLECGIISDRCGGLDTLSCGPTIENPHSPDERLYLPSVQKVWDFLIVLLALR
jgi:dipeptidase D